MRSFCMRAVMVAGLGLSASACSQPPPPTPPFNLKDPIGGTGTNGLKPALFHPYGSELDDFAAKPLVNQGTMTVSRAIDTFVTQQPDENALLVKTVGCALDSGEIAVDGALSWPGNGLLSTTSRWTTTPLGAGQRRDLLTCIVTRLNPSGTTVPIWITGASVNRDPAKGAVGPEPGHFDFTEAHWLATTVDGCRLLAFVWPSGSWKALCGSADILTAAARTRVCGTREGSATCDVEIGEDAWCHEEQGQGIWFCDLPKKYGFPPHQPAIETRLQRQGWRAMHPALEGAGNNICRAPE